MFAFLCHACWMRKMQKMALFMTLCKSPQVNKEIVVMQRVGTAAGETQLRRLIEAHVDKTSSAKGKQILESWDTYLPKFWQLVPPSEANSPEANAELKAAGEPLLAQSA